MDFSVTTQKDGIVFKIYVQPRSSKNTVVGVHGDALKIKLAAPPVDGAANKMCIVFLAKILGVPKSSVQILAGESSRNKRIFAKADTTKKGRTVNDLKQTVLSLV